MGTPYQKRPLTGQLVSSKTKSGKPCFEGHIYLTDDINITLKGYVNTCGNDTFMNLTGHVINYKNKNVPVEVDSGYITSNGGYVDGTNRRTHNGKILIGGAKFNFSVWKKIGTDGRPNWFNLTVNKNRSFDESMELLMNRYKQVDDTEIEIDLGFDDDIEIDLDGCGSNLLFFPDRSECYQS